MHFGYLNAILLYRDNRHVSATRVSIFRVVSTRIQIYLECIGITPRLVIQFWLKFWLNVKNIAEYKLLQVKNCCL